MTILYTDPLFLQHETGRHPERPARLQAITERLQQTDLPDRCTRPQLPAPLTPEQASALHAPWLVAHIKELAEQGGGRTDPDTFVSPASYEVALTAAGVCAGAVDAVLQAELTGSDRNALCLVRPPGHHATPTRSMGFCLFNSIALAAHHARTVHGLKRILIVDWDVHHGNGTQDIFYSDPDVLFLSVHRYGSFYPGTGPAEDTGEGPGQGWNRNVPLSVNVTRAEHCQAFTRALEECADRCKPELVLLSAGFDAHALDPLGGMRLETEDFASFTQQVLEVARTHADGRLVSILEGGYNLDALAECVQAHLEVLLEAK